MNNFSGKVFECADKPNGCFIKGNPLYMVQHARVIKAQFRNPKSGEWYLSGAIPQLYKSKNDLTTGYWACTVEFGRMERGLNFKPIINR